MSCWGVFILKQRECPSLKTSPSLGWGNKRPSLDFGKKKQFRSYEISFLKYKISFIKPCTWLSIFLIRSNLIDAIIWQSPSLISIQRINNWQSIQISIWITTKRKRFHPQILAKSRARFYSKGEQIFSLILNDRKSHPTLSNVFVPVAAHDTKTKPFAPQHECCPWHWCTTGIVMEEKGFRLSLWQRLGDNGAFSTS